MKKNCGHALFILAIFLLLITGTAQAGESHFPGYVYAGLEYGAPSLDMETRFVRDISGSVIEDSQFHNEYSANAGGLFLGYALPWKSVYLGIQGHFNTLDNGFELASGSSTYINEINHTYGVDLVPGVYIYKGISLFGKLGWIQGDVDFIKSSPTSTTYDVHTRLNGYTLGGGLAWDIAPRFTVKLGFEKQSYSTEEIRASLSVMNDTTWVDPSGEKLFVTLQYNFR